ncbi:MAG: tetratricopeptide repeat protein, partial [Reinekea sp.]
MTAMSDHKTSFETIWAELKLTLDWHQDFALFFVLVEHSKAAIELRQRLDDYAHSYGKILSWIKPESIDDAQTTSIQQLFSDSHRPGMPIWLELSALDVEQRWDEVRWKVLSVLNKRRSQLENIIDSPVFIQLPYAFAPRIVECAPDLWTIRQQVIELRAEPEFSPEPSLQRDHSADSEKSEHISEQIQSARQQLQVARVKYQQQSSHLNKRRLAICLHELSGLLVDISKLAEAEDLAKEGLQYFQELQQSLGDSPQVLRDLSVSLESLGDVQQSLGDLKAAEGSYQQSLTIRKQLQQSLGDSPQVLRDLSVSLERLGDVQQSLGDLKAAEG